MIQCQHTMGFTAAKRRFQLNDRLAILAADAAQRLNQQSLHAFGDIGAAEKFDGVAIFVCALAAGYLSKVCGEFCIFVASLRHVGMRLNDVPPAGEAGHGRALHDAQRFFLGGRLHIIAGGGHGAFLAAIAHGAQQLLDFLLRLCVDFACQQRNGIQRALRLSLGKIRSADMRPLIAEILGFLGPGARGVGQNIFEKIAPMAVDQIQAGRHVQRIHALGEIVAIIQVIALAVAQHTHNALRPPEVIALVIRNLHDLLHDIRSQLFAENAERLPNDCVIRHFHFLL